MVRPIIHDPIFLQRTSEKAMKEDVEVARDLADTLRAHIDHCAGLAANMIGVNKCILAVADGKEIIVMLNPELMKHSLKSYRTEEGCLSLIGARHVERYESIEVRYRDETFHKQRRKFRGITAQAIQHEMDHFRGRLI